MTDEETRHNRFHPETHRVMITFRGSSPEDQELRALVEDRARTDGVPFVQVIRTALRQYLKPTRRR